MEECIFYDFWKDCLFSLNCVYDALFEILPKFNFESDLQGRNQATVGCWHNYLISISKWNWYSSLPRTFFIFQTEKYLLRSNLKKYLHLRSNLTNRDCWHAIIRLSPLIGGGKWRERKSNFISLYVPQYFSSYLPQYFFIFAPNICWKSRREQLMFRSRDNRRHKYWWQVTK